MNLPGRAIEFVVPGRAQPAGSKRAFRKKDGGVIVTDDNPAARPWKTAVAAEGAAALDGQTPLDGALRLSILFVVARPKSHYGAGRHSERVRPSAPAFPTVRPDLTKLVRAVEDGLTGALWRDDAQVVDQHVAKRYGWPEQTRIMVSEYADPA